MLIYGIESAEQRAHAAFAVIADALFNFLFRALEIIRKEFDTDKYQVLLVANKYQTGFDQPKLCAMYVLKKLKGVNAVQTLSRLNRICAPYDKKTFVLDFVNSYEDINYWMSL